MERNSNHLYLSVVTVAEIEDGISKAARAGASQKTARLSEWLETILHLYSARILPIDIEIARLAGRLSDVARGRGHTPGFADLLIAATAQARDHVILTRNLRHFLPLGVAAHNPLEGLP